MLIYGLFFTQFTYHKGINSNDTRIQIIYLIQSIIRTLLAFYNNNNNNISQQQQTNERRHTCCVGRSQKKKKANIFILSFEE